MEKKSSVVATKRTFSPVSGGSFPGSSVTAFTGSFDGVFSGPRDDSHPLRRVPPRPQQAPTSDSGLTLSLDFGALSAKEGQSVEDTTTCTQETAELFKEMSENPENWVGFQIQTHPAYPWRFETIDEAKARFLAEHPRT